MTVRTENIYLHGAKRMADICRRISTRDTIHIAAGGC